MDKKIVVSMVIALVIAAMAAFIILLSLPLAEPLLWAMLIGISTYPHYERLARRNPDRPGRAAAIMVVIVTLCIILPIAWLLFAIAQNATTLYHQSQEFIQQAGTSGTAALSKIPYVDRLMQMADRYGVDITGHASQIATRASHFLLAATSGAVKNVAHFALTLGMAIFILYFVYRDGEYIVEASVRRFASNVATGRRYVTQIREATTAVMIGTVLTALAQGFLAGLGYFVADLPAYILFGSLTAVGALVPVVGAALVWVPLAAYLAITGAYLKAGLLTGWCAIFVGLADNAIRPLAIGSKSDIPVMAIVFGAVGGAQMFGLVGLIAGPIIFAVVVIIWRDLTGQSAEAAP
ncbi:AI-2E family transporter [Geomonas sp. RF6]|uniref:AI-2E family transporter n=1 Tax=Geomonas sp. RF6 TaxID=2897342 RepID=UPI001E53099A|nr:AI-2E family transporter [Geomonas sp. RF6]UFS68539.1 AI-2E family transporter [Geomonas sp. RF6]